MMRLAELRVRSAQRHQDCAGIALIFVMISVTVLGIMAAIFAFQMKVETKLAQNANSETELIWLGRSGVERARYILSQQLALGCEPYDSLDQVWAGGMGGPCTSNSALANISLKDFELGYGKFSLTITDLERKYNINRDPNDPVSEQVLERALTLVGVDAGDISAISAAILDWIDPDDRPHANGVESSYYEALDPPYFAKNGPIDDLSELLFVRGVTPDIYWGGVATNHQRGPFQNRFGFGMRNPEIPVRPVGLSDLFTPISGGKININTASAEVLQLIPGIDSVTAEAIVAGRQGGDDGSGLLGPYRNVQEVRRLPEVNPVLIPALQQFCDVRSRTFEVKVDAEIAGYKRQFTAILGRNSPKDIQVLTFSWEE